MPLDSPQAEPAPTRRSRRLPAAPASVDVLVPAPSRAERRRAVAVESTASVTLPGDAVLIELDLAATGEETRDSADPVYTVTPEPVVAEDEPALTRRARRARPAAICRPWAQGALTGVPATAAPVLSRCRRLKAIQAGPCAWPAASGGRR